MHSDGAMQVNEEELTDALSKPATEFSVWYFALMQKVLTISSKALTLDIARPEEKKVSFLSKMISV